ncbi:MAG: NUMOD4 domain-containing protein [Tunicatimonas sp.]
MNQRTEHTVPPPSATSPHPYQDRQTALLSGEVWRDVPGYQGYYQVSSLGRVKSLDRVVPHPRLGEQTVYGRLLTQKVVVNINTISEEKMVDLQVSLSMEGRQHYRNVRRLVYAAFVEPINYQRDGRYVINRNGNGYDNSVNNLALITRAKKSQRALRRGRVPESYLKSADRSEWKEKTYGGMSRLVGHAASRWFNSAVRAP